VLVSSQTDYFSSINDTGTSNCTLLANAHAELGEEMAYAPVWQ
jgi:hypothetical protein